MSYIDAMVDRKTDKILIVERDSHGQRVLREVPANYVFYYEDSAGHHKSIFGHTCKRFSTPSSFKFRSVLKEQRERGRRIFESDINPVFRYLADHYMAAEVPTANIGFFDIEADFHPEKGYAPPENPFNAVTAISLYRSFDQRLLSYALKPPTVAQEAVASLTEGFSDTQIYTDEKALLRAFLEGIENVDCLSGWNSSAYDIPYLVNRVKRLLGEDATRKFCLWDQLPAKREYTNKFSRLLTTYDFIGRVHLDYLELYIKHNTQQRLSYALNAIGEIEVGEVKTPYDGTLDDLYKKDFRKFIEYNRQDVMLMVKIDQKNKFLDLANQIAHANCVLLKTTMGSVALVEAAIINEMHAMGGIVPDRKPRKDDRAKTVNPETEYDRLADAFRAEAEDDDDEVHAPVVGAYVAQPKKGLHEHVGAVDINSLYPSAIRALNMSPETLIGQVRPDETTKLIEERVAKLSATHRAEAWEGLFSILEVQHMHDQDDSLLTVDFFDHLTDTVTTKTMTGKQLHDYVFDETNHVCITANGTIFRTDIEGMIPRLLARWYADRKVMQRQAKEYTAMAAGVEIDEDLKCLLIE